MALKNGICAEMLLFIKRLSTLATRVPFLRLRVYVVGSFLLSVLVIYIYCMNRLYHGRLSHRLSFRIQSRIH